MLMTVREVVRGYWDDEESRDLTAILSHYRPDAELVVPEMGRLQGHEEIRRFYEPSIRRFPSLQVDILQGFESNDGGAFEWRATFVDQGGRTLVLQGVNVVSVDQGRFRSVHVYYDPEPLEQLGRE